MNVDFIKLDFLRLKTQFYSYADEICDGLKDISKGSKKNENFDELFHCILYCLQPAVRSRIRIYSLDNDRDLDDTIFEAIIHGKETFAIVIFFQFKFFSKTREKFGCFQSKTIIEISFGLGCD